MLAAPTCTATATRGVACRGRGWMRSDNRDVNGLARGARPMEVEQVLGLFTRGSQSLNPGSQPPPRCGETHEFERVWCSRVIGARSKVVEQLLGMSTTGYAREARAHPWQHPGIPLGCSEKNAR